MGLDPGTSQSALVILDGNRILDHLLDSNEVVLGYLEKCETPEIPLVIEQMASMGMAVGQEVFATVFWSGRFAQAYGYQFFQLPRVQVKRHLCGTHRATDTNVRAALLDLWGGKEKAIGRKASPGPLHGIHSHLFSALGIARTWYDTRMR
jgi:hypothetical protein